MRMIGLDSAAAKRQRWVYWEKPRPDSQASGNKPLACLSTKQTGMQDLSNTIPAWAGWKVPLAKAINARGQIVGVGAISATAQTHVVPLDPTVG